MTTRAPTDPYAQQGRAGLRKLQEQEAALPGRMARNVENVAELATTLAGFADALARQRGSLVGLAEALERTEGAGRLTVPPARTAIPAVDADGLLWAALETGDAAAVARALGEVAARSIEKGTAHG